MFNKLQKGVSDVLEFPPDVMGDGPRISINGRRLVIIENFSSIIGFSSELIELETTEGRLKLTGKEFILKTLLPTELQIEGILISLAFEEGEEGK